MRVWTTKTSTAGEWQSLQAWVPAGGLREPLSPMDAVLLTSLNCASLSFSYTLSFDTLLQATELLVEELPIIAGRLTPASKADIARHPHLKEAPYNITLGPQHAGVLVCEASTDAAAAALDLNREMARTATPFSMFGSKVVLPPWYQPMDVPALLKGREPLLKLQLTHCSDGGCVLAATVPHLLTDSHSTCLLFTRLSQLYRQVAGAQHLSLDGTPQSTLAQAAAATTAGRSSSPPAEATVEATTARVAATTASPAEADASSKAQIPWSKSLLMLKQGARLPTDEELQALSQHHLDGGSADPPSLLSTLKWLAAAVKASMSANKRFPGATSSLTRVLLRIPDDEVAALKVKATTGSAPGTPTQPSLSTNDALTALLWLLICDLRGRTLPGSSSSSTGSSSSGGFKSLFSCLKDPDIVCGDKYTAAPVGGTVQAGPAAPAPAGVLGMAVDLRRNCSSSGSSGGSGSNGSSGPPGVGGSSSKRPFLPSNYFGNAPCAVLMAQPQSAVGGEGSSSTSLTSSLSAAAAVVRGTVNAFRACEGSGDLLLRFYESQLTAPPLATVRNMSRLLVRLDAYITSWTYPIAAVDFGAGPPVDYCCLVNMPPWVAAVLPRLPHEQHTRLVLTLPTSAVPALRESPVLRQLMPGAVVITAGDAAGSGGSGSGGALLQAGADAAARGP